MIRLRVWANLRPMGWFGHAGANYFFEYDTQWLADDAAYPLAPQFALQPQTYAGETVKIFFSNLLPEGVPLEEILNAMQWRDANAFDVIGSLGAELPGVLSVLPEGETPVALQDYVALSLHTLSQRIQARAQHKPLLLSNAQSRMSLAGEQDKLGLRYDAKRQLLYESMGSSPSTHIAKPDSRLANYKPSAVNEFACMRLAKAMKLPVPPVSLLKVPESVLIVQRYDRVSISGNIVCLHQVDGCQLLGVGADWKYERQGGLVSLKKLIQLLRGLNLSGKDMLNVQRWVMFNYLIGNSDAHAKNISVMINDKGYVLAPFYDLLSVQAYGDNSLALFIGDEDSYASVGAHSWQAFCEDCGFGFKPAMALFRKMALDIPKAWASVEQQIKTEHPLSADEIDLLASVKFVIEGNCQAALSMTG